VLAQREVDGAPGEVPGFQPLLADLELVSAYTFTCRSAYGLTCRSSRGGLQPLS
jgi:hypothetical protein